MLTYSFVIPVHNEQEMLEHLFDALRDLTDRLDGPSEFVLVDDGSSDASWPMLVAQARRDLRYRLVRLSRNFGHQVAVTAGVDHARGDAVVIMDADLQDPPEVVLEMARRWRDGYQVVYGLRTDRDEDTWFKRTTAGAFYRVLNGLSSVDIPAQVGDFRLIDRVVADAIREMPERNRYLRGMFSWLGFSQVAVPYHRPARRAGSTSYSLNKMLNLANDGVIGYSKAPLRAVLSSGVVALGAGAAGVVGAGVAAAVGHRRRGWITPSLRVLTFGAQVAAVGVVGEYVSRIFDESIGRPLYVVRDVVEVVDGVEGVEGIAAADDRVAATGDLTSGQLHDLFGSRHQVRTMATARAAGPGT